MVNFIDDYLQINN